MSEPGFPERVGQSSYHVVGMLSCPSKAVCSDGLTTRLPRVLGGGTRDGTTSAVHHALRLGLRDVPPEATPFRQFTTPFA